MVSTKDVTHPGLCGDYPCHAMAVGTSASLQHKPNDIRFYLLTGNDIGNDRAAEEHRKPGETEIRIVLAEYFAKRQISPHAPLSEEYYQKFFMHPGHLNTFSMSYRPFLVYRFDPKDFDKNRISHIIETYGIAALLFWECVEERRNDNHGPTSWRYPADYPTIIELRCKDIDISYDHDQHLLVIKHKNDANKRCMVRRSLKGAGNPLIVSTSRKMVELKLDDILRGEMYLLVPETPPKVER